MTESIDSTSSSFMTPLESQLRQSATLKINELVQEEMHKVVELCIWALEKQHFLYRVVLRLQFDMPASLQITLLWQDVQSLERWKKSKIRRRRCWYWTKTIAKSQSRHLTLEISPVQVVITRGSKPLFLRTVWYLTWGCTSSASLRVSHEP